MADGTDGGPQTRDLRQRLIALGGIVVIVGVAVVVLLAAGVLGNQGGGTARTGIEIEDVLLLDTQPLPGQPDPGVGPSAGKLAPDFEVSDFDGARHRLSDFRGKVVLVNLWATWCVPCQVELPDQQELLDSHPDDLAIITVNRAEPVGRAQDFFEVLPNNDGGVGVSFTVDGLDPGDTLFNEYRGLGMPMSAFIDANGVVTRVHNGLLRLEQMEEAFAEALQSGSAGDDSLTSEPSQ
jgi:thiol-disulfide isomerase/thioredoxin